jgi:hypothetical protein
VLPGAGRREFRKKALVELASHFERSSEWKKNGLTVDCQWWLVKEEEDVKVRIIAVGELLARRASRLLTE